MIVVGDISMITYDSRNKLHGRGAHTTPIGIPSACWKYENCGNQKHFQITCSVRIRGVFSKNKIYLFLEWDICIYFGHSFFLRIKVEPIIFDSLLKYRMAISCVKYRKVKSFNSIEWGELPWLCIFLNSHLIHTTPGVPSTMITLNTGFVRW